MKNVLIYTMLMLFASMLVARTQLIRTQDYPVQESPILMDIDNTMDLYYFSDTVSNQQIVRKSYHADQHIEITDVLWSANISDVESGDYQWQRGERLYGKLWFYIGFNKLLLIVCIDGDDVSHHTLPSPINLNFDIAGIQRTFCHFGEGRIYFVDSNKLKSWDISSGACTILMNLSDPEGYRTLVKLGEEYLAFSDYNAQSNWHNYLVYPDSSFEQTNLQAWTIHSAFKLCDGMYWVQRQRMESGTSYNGSGTIRIQGNTITDQTWWEEDMWYGGYEEERPILLLQNSMLLCNRMYLYGSNPITHNFVLKERLTNGNYANYGGFPQIQTIMGSQIYALNFAEQLVLIRCHEMESHSSIDLYLPDMDEHSLSEVSFPDSLISGGWPIFQADQNALWMLIQNESSTDLLYAYRDEASGLSNDTISPAPVDLLFKPNPFRHNVEISCNKDIEPHSELKIYNTRGQIINQLIPQAGSSGNRIFSWDGRDSDGKPVSSGIYLIRYIQGQRSVIRRMIKL